MEYAPVDSEPQREVDARFVWRLFGLIGLLFAIMGLVNLVLAWYPVRIGTPEWEFGAIGAFLDATPSFALGIGLLLGSALAGGARGWIRTLAIVLLLSALTVAAMGVLYTTTIPIALNNVSSSAELSAVKKAVAKAGLQMVVLPVGLLWAAVMGWRASSRGHTR